MIGTSRFSRFSVVWFGAALVLLFPSIMAGQVELPERLDLTRAIALALANNPELRAAEYRFEGRQQFTIFSDVRSNPSITLQTENWRFSRNPAFVPSDEVDLFAFVTQPLPTGNKRSRRFEVASTHERIAELELEGLRWRIQQEVKLAFWQALAAQKELELIRENLSYFSDITEFHRIRVQEGAMAEADLIRVLLEEKRIELQEAQADLEAQTARARLLRAMGSPSHSTTFEIVDLPLDQPVAGGITQNELTRTAQNRRIEIQLAKTRVETARSQLQLEMALGRPDLEVIFGYKRSSGFDTLLGGIHIPLPLFDRNLGEISVSRSEVDRTEAVLEGTIRRVLSEVSELVASLKRRHSMLIELETGMLDRAEESWRISRAAYQEGATDLLRLLDSQRALNEITRLHTRTQMAYQINLIELETAVGTSDLAVGTEIFDSEP